MRGRLLPAEHAGAPFALMLALVSVGCTGEISGTPGQADARVDAAMDASLDAPPSSPFPATLAPLLGYDWEARVDLDGNGTWDAIWSLGTNADGTCTLALHRWEHGAVLDPLWATTLPECAGTPFAPLFHWRSFMGSPLRDFTIVIQGPGGDQDYWLLAGDGATGELRDFRLSLDQADAASHLRFSGVATVDYELEDSPGAALLVRTVGTFHGRLYFFPDGSPSAVEISADPRVILPSQPYSAYPFPGVDLPLDASMPPDPYTFIYDGFNADLHPCAHITEAYPGGCGVPSPDPTVGGGYFLDKLAIGDIDADGVEDALMTFLWRSVVYPGVPKGSSDPRYLGAPQYDSYYNPQEDGGGCHSGRHYGPSFLVEIDDDPYLETVDLAGVYVGRFNDFYQNVSRNVAVVDTLPDPAGLPTVVREVLWNLPKGTSIPACGPLKLFDHAIHYPRDGLIERDGRTRFIHFNEWSQGNHDSRDCTIAADLDECRRQMLVDQSGFWTWRVVGALDGAEVFAEVDAYVWDALVDPSGAGLWLIYSSQASTWNLGTVSLGSTEPLLRSDLSVGFFDLETLTLASSQSISEPAAPVLRFQHWQSLRGAVGSNWPARLLVTLEAGRDAPAFVVQTSTGFSLYALDAAGSGPLARYDSEGTRLP
jgi:hypothetical protein